MFLTIHSPSATHGMPIEAEYRRMSSHTRHQRENSAEADSRARWAAKQKSGAPRLTEPTARTRVLTNKTNAGAELAHALKRFAAWGPFDVTAQQNTRSAQASGTRSHALADKRTEAQRKVNLGHTTGAPSREMAGREDTPQLETPRTGYVRHSC